MVIHRIGPDNLPGIRKHFETKIKEIKKKLVGINKSRFKLEQELVTMEDGKKWCDKLFEARKDAKKWVNLKIT